MRTRIIGACSAGLAALLATSTFAEVPDELLATPLAELFGAAPTIAEPKLSPRGTHLIFLQQNAEGITVLQNLDLSDGSVATLLQGSRDGHDIVWCAFANETRILCDLRRGIPGYDAEYQRFYSLNADGSDLEELRRGTGCTARDPLRDTYPIDWLPDDSEHIMFFCGSSASRLNIDSRRVTSVIGAGESGSRKRLYSDGRGLGNIYSGRIGNTDRWFHRDSIDADWIEFDEINPLEFEEPFRPVGYGPETDRVFNIAWNEDTGTWALSSRALSGDFENTLAVTHPLVDLQLVNTMGPRDRVVSVPYIDGRTTRHIVDDRIEEVHQFITELLPQLDVVEILDESWDGNVYLARVKAGLQVGELIAVNMENEAVQAIGSEYAHLSPYLMAPTELVEFAGADGGAVTGYLTLPEGTVGTVPAVIVPRSAPSHENVSDPHYLVQFLAASGYAVLRINNRGPAEHGGGWIPERSVVGWNRSADDVSSAARFLVDEGVSDADSICALGKNYGAYASLMSAIKYPELLQCVVSVSGIVDPRASAGNQMVGTSSVLSSDFLDEASPVRRAADIVPPVLLFHGRNDPSVRMAAHAVSLSNAMRSAGKDVRFFEYTFDDHDIARGPYRTDMLTRIGNFLVEHIGQATLAEIEEGDQGEAGGEDL